MLRALIFLPVLLGLPAASPAHAAGLTTPTPPLEPIYNGTEVAACGWPSVVSMEGACSGTLVHPEVVIYAGHCGTGYDSVQFGEVGETPARSVDTAGCFTQNGVGDGHDFAVCRLAEPVTDIPIVPILMGCEVGTALQPGATVTLIGFGEANNGPYGHKRETTSQIVEFDHGEIFIMNDKAQDTCYGDSGGPVMIQLDDGSWRVFGITSYGVDTMCGTGTWYSMMHNGIDWFEAMTGVDITPCNTPDGTWDPGPDCGGFPLDPGAPAGTWATGCQADAAVSAPSSTCGPAFGGRADLEAPLVAIQSPKQGQTYKTVNTLPLTIAATARDGVDQAEGWGIEQVSLVINGQDVPKSVLHVPPYTWDIKLPMGAFLISARAVDNSGNEALATVAIGVNTDPPELPEEGTSTGEASTGADTEPATTTDTPTTGAPEGPTTGDGSSSSDSASATAGQDDDGGCGCRQSPPPATFGLAALALLGLRRRRR